MIYIRYTISKISFSYIMYISIILCRNYLQIVRSNYVYFGQINESVCLSVLYRTSISIIIFMLYAFKLQTETNLLDGSVALHLCLHAASLSNRLGFPSHPPYVNCLHRLVDLSKYQRINCLSQLPLSRGMLHRSERKYSFI